MCLIQLLPWLPIGMLESQGAVMFYGAVFYYVALSDLFYTSTSSNSPCANIVRKLKNSCTGLGREGKKGRLPLFLNSFFTSFRVTQKISKVGNQEIGTPWEDDLNKKVGIISFECTSWINNISVPKTKNKK